MSAVLTQSALPSISTVSGSLSLCSMLISLRSDDLQAVQTPISLQVEPKNDYSKKFKFFQNFNFFQFLSFFYILG